MHLYIVHVILSTLPVAADAAVELVAVVDQRSIHPTKGTDRKVPLAVQLLRRAVEVLLVNMAAEENRESRWKELRVLRRRRTQADCPRELLDSPSFPAFNLYALLIYRPHRCKKRSNNN